MSIEKTPEELVAGFVSLLSVTREGDDAFSGLKQPNGVGRVFGGQVIAQALQAAQATAPEGVAGWYEIPINAAGAIDNISFQVVGGATIYELGFLSPGGTAIHPLSLAALKRVLKESP